MTTAAKLRRYLSRNNRRARSTKPGLEFLVFLVERVHALERFDEERQIRPSKVDLGWMVRKQGRGRQIQPRRPAGGACAVFDHVGGQFRDDRREQRLEPLVHPRRRVTPRERVVEETASHRAAGKRDRGTSSSLSPTRAVSLGESGSWSDAMRS